MSDPLTLTKVDKPVMPVTESTRDEGQLLKSNSPEYIEYIEPLGDVPSSKDCKKIYALYEKNEKSQPLKKPTAVYSLNEAQILKSIYDSPELKKIPYVIEQKKIIDPEVESISQKNLDKIHRYVFRIPNLFRLFAVMLDRTLSFYNKGFLPSKFGIFGVVLYGVEFLYCLGKIGYATFAPDPEAPTSRWTRFKNIMQKDGMISDLVNSGVWTVLNLTSFVLTAGMLPLAITMAGLAFDLCHMTGTAIYNIYSNWSIKKKEMGEIKYRPDVKNKDLDTIKPKLKANVESVAQREIYKVTMTCLIAVGFGMSLFPPLAPAGAAIVFIAGCVMFGLGKFLFDETWKLVHNYYHPAPKPGQEQTENSMNTQRIRVFFRQNDSAAQNQTEKQVEQPIVQSKKPGYFERVTNSIGTLFSNNHNKNTAAVEHNEVKKESLYDRIKRPFCYLFSSHNEIQTTQTSDSKEQIKTFSPSQN